MHPKVCAKIVVKKWKSPAWTIFDFFHNNIFLAFLPITFTLTLVHCHHCDFKKWTIVFKTMKVIVLFFWLLGRRFGLLKS